MGWFLLEHSHEPSRAAFIPVAEQSHCSCDRDHMAAESKTLSCPLREIDCPHHQQFCITACKLYIN